MVDTEEAIATDGVTPSCFPIRLCSSTSDEGEWVLLELQGEVTRKRASGESVKVDEDPSYFRNSTLGRLDNGDTEDPVLVIGNYRLEGKRVKLSNPLALLRRKDKENEFESLGLVYKKLVFKTRPKPLSNAVPLQSSTKKTKLLG